MIQLISIAGIGVVVVYLGLLLVLWSYQERIVFQPPSGFALSEGEGNRDTGARRVRYRASDGVELFGYLVGDCSRNSSANALLAFHGNADIARWLVPWAVVAAREANACVLVPEYRGYDGLAGQPSYDASSLDARAALAYLRDVVGVPPSRTIYFGHSLGTAIAAELAVTDPPRALILQSPFSSARAMGGRMFLPGIVALWGLVSRVHYDTIQRVASSDVPVWVVHGDKDFVVPVRMGREVFAAARNKGELLVVHDAGHNDVADVGGRDYWSWFVRGVRDSAGLATRGARAEMRSEP